MELINLRNGDMIANRVEIADSFLPRLVGLLGRKKFPENNAMVLKPCRSIHTFFLKFCIDVVFLNCQGEVVHLITNMPSYRLSPVIKKAKKVVELPAGTVKNRVNLGDTLIIV